MEYLFVVKSTMIESIIYSGKTALSEANVKTNRMGITKWTYHKEHSFSSSYFIFLKILFHYKSVIKSWFVPNTKCPYSYFSKVLEFYLRMFFSLWVSLKLILLLQLETISIQMGMFYVSSSVVPACTLKLQGTDYSYLKKPLE